MPRFESKVVVVSGATSGIGAATARRFASESAFVACLGRNRDRGTELANKINANGGKAIFYPCDVTVEKQVAEVIADITHKFGRVDILFNNAGTLVVRNLSEMTEDEWYRTMDTNVKSVFLLSKHALPWLAKTKGVIINNGSELGLIGAPKYTAYCASKGAVILLTKALAIECAPLGVRVNCVCPGSTETRMMQGEFELLSKLSNTNVETLRKEVADNIPLHRIASPDEIASVVLFLASDESSYVTGATWSVDAGTTTK